MAKRQNRSKYNFGKLKIEESFKLHPIDLYSMQVALKSFNKRHGTDIELGVNEISDRLLQITRIR